MKKGLSRTQRFTKSQGAELKRRRRALMRIMGENSIAVIPAARSCTRSRDTEYPYRADSNMLYLSGFDEPDALMVLIPGRRAGQYLMFCRERDAEKETWHGRLLGVEDAPEALGADDAFPITDLDDILPGLLENKASVFHTLGKDLAFDAQLLGWLNQARSSRRRAGGDPDSFISLDFHLDEMRVIKSRTELTSLRAAAKLSASAHARAMRAAKPGMYEYQLEAELIAEYRAHHADHSFLPIVGGGENGCILHYTENKDVLENDELVLIDSGAELAGYAGDITRTFPVNGVFTEAQKTVYNIVLEAQLAAIDAIKPGNHWNEPHEAAVKVLTRGLRDIGVLKGKLPTLIKEEAYKPYYMHRTGHWLGMDVHDVGEYKINGDWRELEPGMVLTVEPGLYLGDARKIPKAYRNIGIRIEDDIAVTQDGHEVLTGGVPKTVADIEAFMCSHD
ncbi:aminopeptidase P N-terminal domain-containing protein [Granulosicoccus antarcticus]|uniref:Xaa-Pro aminopeptidase n=1 Tax=Granulosicoccus antarcticus IMCC3135 TaxID=1192854 RepID=A0A2Z2NX02_9GAMM|nr:aminopeptidase P N-terminal domain-containing protein [Granulosicoccus antarcticus]ASJ75976.1 Xaa-Pro aminopeptidase [Granulosicoccus antarcticus IMCC3135]